MPQIETHVSLKPYNTFGIDVPARHFVRVTTLAALRSVLSLPALQAMPRLILGGGSNILLTQPFDGLVIKLALLGKAQVSEDDEAVHVKAMAGENWHDFVCWTIQQGWAGLENLSLIPGTVGASPIQNIGAYGVEMKDCFHSLTALEVSTGTVHTFDHAACRFAYRDSMFKHVAPGHYIILDVTFRLPKKPQWHTSYGEVQAELARQGVVELSAQAISDAICTIRRRKLPDPAQIGNAGSFFKNPVVSTVLAESLKKQFNQMPTYPQPDGTTKLAAGWLIDQCGWKGHVEGAVGVYEKQALVLINRGGAAGSEICNLAKRIQHSVMAKFGIEIEPEPLIL
ncbi:UDP-N-acetylmuramate dehydrogenase [Chitinivorax tropicus]|nr:UDP-N-acetylmuramate dehydrogenase [Chitinivorax tropicus]